MEKIRTLVRNLDGSEHIEERFETQEEIFAREKFKEEQKTVNRVSEIKKRLSELSQDFMQAQLGAEIEDIEIRKLEFKALHNELRALLGKPSRIYQEFNIEGTKKNETKDN